jgi:hypothetical protein
MIIDSRIENEIDRQIETQTRRSDLQNGWLRPEYGQEVEGRPAGGGGGGEGIGRGGQQGVLEM